MKALDLKEAMCAYLSYTWKWCKSGSYEWILKKTVNLKNIYTQVYTGNSTYIGMHAHLAYTREHTACTHTAYTCTHIAHTYTSTHTHWKTQTYSPVFWHNMFTEYVH